MAYVEKYGTRFGWHKKCTDISLILYMNDSQHVLPLTFNKFKVVGFLPSRMNRTRFMLFSYLLELVIPTKSYSITYPSIHPSLPYIF